MKTQDLTKDTKGEIVIYQSEEGKAVIDVILQDETVWVTQEQMVALFGKAKSTISEHLKHIFEEGELDPNSVVRFFRTTAADGKSRSTINEHILNIYKEGELSEADTVRKIGISDFSTKPTNFYNLDVVISVESDYDRAIRQLSLFSGSTEQLSGETSIDEE